MNKEKLLVSAILFKHNVPIEEAKVIGNLIEEKDKEINRLNHECDTYMKIATKKQHIIDELEKWVKENNINNRDIYGYEMEDKVIYLEDFLDKLKELQGSDKE